MVPLRFLDIVCVIEQTLLSTSYIVRVLFSPTVLLATMNIL